jgi:hypothetical protein
VLSIAVFSDAITAEQGNFSANGAALLVYTVVGNSSNEVGITAQASSAAPFTKISWNSRFLPKPLKPRPLDK